MGGIVRLLLKVNGACLSDPERQNLQMLHDNVARISPGYLGDCHLNDERLDLTVSVTRMGSRENPSNNLKKNAFVVLGWISEIGLMSR